MIRKLFSALFTLALTVAAVLLLVFTLGFSGAVEQGVTNATGALALLCAFAAGASTAFRDSRGAAEANLG